MLRSQVKNLEIICTFRGGPEEIAETKMNQAASRHIWKSHVEERKKLRVRHGHPHGSV